MATFSSHDGDGLGRGIAPPGARASEPAALRKNTPFFSLHHSVLCPPTRWRLPKSLIGSFIRYPFTPQVSSCLRAREPVESRVRRVAPAAGSEARAPPEAPLFPPQALCCRVPKSCQVSMPRGGNLETLVRSSQHHRSTAAAAARREAGFRFPRFPPIAHRRGNQPFSEISASPAKQKLTTEPSSCCRE